ncbi:hypothetical protein [Alteromonas halophila]|uniref:Uncharacterized protein n=1 Tax=Alteromonas halophila TaxID=516698 RepID=A0A918MZC0_9ALTE|nr:hypothetical protein [Alteromonas halophila]GGW89260.1 hypothetical protein GCM10007391_24350 [Alteromonas halophila]
MESVSGIGRFTQIDPVRKNATPEPNKVFELDKLANKVEPQTITNDSTALQQQPGPTVTPNNSSDIAKIVNSQASSVNQTYGPDADQRNATPGSIFTTRA